MNRLLPLFLILILLSSCATKSPGEKEVVEVSMDQVAVLDEDLAGMLKFNENSDTVKAEVTVKSFID